LKGTFEIKTKPHVGTKVIITIPLEIFEPENLTNEFNTSVTSIPWEEFKV